jgi:hypothetical protein
MDSMERPLPNTLTKFINYSSIDIPRIDLMGIYHARLLYLESICKYSTGCPGKVNGFPLCKENGLNLQFAILLSTTETI